MELKEEEEKKTQKVKRGKLLDLLSRLNREVVIT